MERKGGSAFLIKLVTESFLEEVAFELDLNDKQHPALRRSWEGHQAVQQLAQKYCRQDRFSQKMRNRDDCGVSLPVKGEGGGGSGHGKELEM